MMIIHQNPPNPQQVPTAASPGKTINKNAIIGIIAVIAVVIVAIAYGLGYLDFLFAAGPSDDSTDEPPVETPKEPIKIGINAPTGLGVGDTASIGITASEADGLFGFQFDLSFDDSILEYQSITEGTFLNNNGADTTFCIDPSTSTAGLIKNYACTRLKANGQVVGVSGTGTLATVTFRVLSTGASSLTLSNVKFADTSANKIDADITSGQIVIS